MATAPQPILDAFDRIKQHMPEAQLSGVVGDAAHSFGYHLAPNQLPRSDYSLQLAADKRGARRHPDGASALDVTLPADLMQTVTRRLLHAAKNHDPRMRAVREFCGTLNGTQTYPWDVANGNHSEGVGSWDDSHLWHVHTSFLRDHSYSAKALLDFADVFAGVPAPPRGPAHPLFLLHKLRLQARDLSKRIARVLPFARKRLANATRKPRHH